MSAIYKIKHAFKSLSKNHKKLAQYIIDHTEPVTQMSVQELSLKSDVSTASIVRFAQKIGYEGYTDLKIDLASDINHYDEQTLFEDHPSLNESFAVFVNQEIKAYHNTIQKTYELINLKTLQQVIDIATHARRIYLIGIGASSAICNDLQIKLSRIDFPVYFYQDAHVQLANSIHLTKDDLIIAISYRGNTLEINTIVTQAIKKEVPTVAITQNNGSPLSRAANFVLPVPYEENEFRLGAITSRNSTQIITDLIYLGLIRTQINKSSEFLIESRKAIYNLDKK